MFYVSEVQGKIRSDTKDLKQRRCGKGIYKKKKIIII